MPVKMTCLLLAALVVNASSVSADPLALLRHCHHNPSLPTEYGHVILRLQPISAIRVPLTAAKVPFATAIGEYDFLSIANNFALNQRVSSFDQIIRHPHTPDTFVFIRGQEIVVFPRVLMFAPQVSLSSVRQDDTIASLFYEPKDRDELRKHLRLVPTQREENIVINLAGPLLAGDQRGRVILDRNSVSVNAFHNPLVNQFGSTIESSIQDRLGATLVGKVPVTVLSRRLGQVNVRYIAPLQKSGIYAEQGQLMQRLRPLNKQSLPPGQEDPWPSLIGDRIGSVVLMNGDVVSYTLLELVPPFHDLAVR